MEQAYTDTKLPTVGSQTPSIGGANWLNPSRITANDGSSSTLGYFSGGDRGATITGSVFGLKKLPPEAVVDGIQLNISGSQVGMYGDVTLNIAGTTFKDLGALNGAYGGPKDKWGATTITPTQIANITASVMCGDVSGGDGIASIDYMSITVFWHIDMIDTPNANVPTRVEYKMFTSKGDYIGLVPNVTSKLAFSQDINSAGSTMQIVSGTYPKNETTTGTLQDDAGNPIQTDTNEPIYTTVTNSIMALGSSDDKVMFKNGNRVQAWIYNYWYPNGKLMFSGQVNKVAFKYGGGTAIALTVYSDGIDLDNYIARGYPFNYTSEVSQTSTTDKVSLIQNIYGQWTFYGQSFRTGAAQTNIGEIQLMMDGAANVIVYLLDGPMGNILASVTKYVSAPDLNTVVSFDFSQLVDVTPSTDYFIRVTVSNNNSIWLYRNSAGGYANGEMYQSDYAGGSGGGGYYPNGGGDLYFVVKSGLPTTTTTYSTQDPVSGMAHKIILDYNNRGGLIKERTFTATALSLTYTFIVATILDVIKKVIELAPTGYYSYVDLGTAEIDILPTSTTPDFRIVRGKDISELDLALTIEQVKNYLLLSGGPTAGVNLFRDYADSSSQSRYGIRLAQKSDNRITLAATADAVGNSFIAENSAETQETNVTILNKMIDITKLVPGKTIGFKNFGSFIDDMVLQITRRDYNTENVKLSLGRLPTTMPAEIQRINRELQMEQTAANPNAPS